MEYEIRPLPHTDFPPLLKEIPRVPKKLWFAGKLPPTENKLLCVVGSRKHTEYGREVCEKLIEGLSGYPITIVSGLALGIDSIAHRAALKYGLQTVAVPGSGLDPKVLYPSSHLGLALSIIDNDGALISEFENNFRVTQWSFPQRNRIMAGISHAVLVIEAEIQSGTLITSRLATDYYHDVFAVPGPIFSKTSEGPHMLIRLGATPITSSEDILKALGFEIHEHKTFLSQDLSSQEKLIIDLLINPQTKDELIRKSDISPSELNMILTAMEIKGYITESMGEIRLSI